MNNLKLTLLSALLICFALPSQGTGTSQVSAIILDSPIDFDNEVLAPLLNTTALKESSIVDDKGVSKSWYDFSNEKKAEFEQHLNSHKFDEQLEFLNSIRKLDSDKFNESEKEKFRQIVKKGMTKLILFRQYREDMNTLASYMHGTHVAGIMTNSLSNISLISFPAVSYAKTREFVKNFNAEKVRAEIRERLELVTKTMRANNVRVANLSYGASYSLASYHFLKAHPWYMQLFIANKVDDVAWEYSKINMEEHARFFAENPNTVFVMAAGNDGNNLEREKNHSAKIESPNVIKVANVRNAETLSGSSNRSNEYVQIGAVGEAVESLRTGGSDTLFMSGTSQAAPKVANKLIEIFQQNNQLSVSEAIHTLYQKHTIQSESLSKYIKDGLILKDTPRICSQVLL